MRVCGGLRPRTPAFSLPIPGEHEATVRVSDVLLEMRGITKEFPGVKALKDVSLLRPARRDPRARRRERGRQVDPDEGRVGRLPVPARYEGQFFFKGEECHFHNIRESEQKGIVIIHQELALVPHLSITENIFLANEQATRGVINWSKSHAKAIELLKKVGLHETPGHEDLPPGRGQAAAGRDREGPVQERRAADPRRAHVLAQRERLPGAAPAAPRVPLAMASRAS